MSDYNGWTNRETWAVNLWLNNDESVYNLIENHLPLTVTGLLSLVSEDILGSYYDKIAQDIHNNWDVVNWEEIAEAWNE